VGIALGSRHGGAKSKGKEDAQTKDFASNKARYVGISNF